MSWQQKERGKKEKRKKLKKSILSYNIGYESMGKRPTLSPSQPVSGQSSAHGKDGGGVRTREMPQKEGYRALVIYRCVMDELSEIELSLTS